MIVFAGIAFAVLVMAIIISLLLRRRLREKYATLWLIIGLVILILSIFPGLLIGMSQLLGVEVPSNLIFALAIVLLVGVSLHLSWELSQAEDEVRRVAEDVAILRADVAALQAAAANPTPDSTDDAVAQAAPSEPADEPPAPRSDELI